MKTEVNNTLEMCLYVSLLLFSFLSSPLSPLCRCRVSLSLFSFLPLFYSSVSQQETGPSQGLRLLRGFPA